MRQLPEWCVADLSQREPLATVFKCVFCNHETSVSVKIDKKMGVGNLSCKSCGQSFQTSTNCTIYALTLCADLC
jgi:transcription elongation factor Elf1